LSATGQNSQLAQLTNLALAITTMQCFALVQKRKLQNRAAQRAFRERKEQHVKDMEVATVAQAAQLQHYYNIIQS